jgi:hypothetical protein
MTAIVYATIALLWPLADPAGIAEITAYWPFALILDVFYAIPGLPICFAFSLVWAVLFRAVISPSRSTESGGPPGQSPLAQLAPHGSTVALAGMRHPPSSACRAAPPGSPGCPIGD